MTGTLPTTIGSYRVVRRIGQGGFATVFECVDDRLDANVAVKLLADNHAFDAEVRSRFLSEGRVLRQVDSRNVIQVHDVGTTDTGQPYLVLELANKGDLHSRVHSLSQTGWEPSVDDVLYVLATLSDAVGALHRKKVVHRDLTPGNLLIKSSDELSTVEVNSEQRRLVEPNERLLVADLGLAKNVGAGTELSILAGTPGFSAPEQLRHGKVTKKVDVYAGAKIVEWLLGFASDQSPWKSRILAGLQPALATDPNQRPDSLNVVQVSINDLLTMSSPQSPQPSTGVHPPPQPPQVEWTSSTSPPPTETQLVKQPLDSSAIKRWLPMLLSAVVVVAIVVGFVTLRGRDTQPESVGENLGRIVQVENGSQVTVTGPERIPVDRTGRFVAAAPEGSEFVWRTSDGVVMSRTGVAELRGAEPGRLRVEVEVTFPSEEQVVVVYPFEVIAQENGE